MDKTNIFIVSPKLNKSFKNITLSINNFLIQIVNSFKYLKIILDNKLSFKNHTANLKNRIARSVGIISKLKHYVPSEILMKLYYILIHPHLLCEILVWRSTFKTYIKKIISLQNKALSLITNNFDFKLHITSSLHKQLNILKLSDINKHKVASFMNKFSNKLTSQIFTNYFVKTYSVHSIEIRHQSDGNF